MATSLSEQVILDQQSYPLTSAEEQRLESERACVSIGR